MKKVILPAVAILVLGFASCKKDYTCKCETKDSSGAVLQSVETTINATKSDAEKSCDATASQVGGMTMTCKIQ